MAETFETLKTKLRDWLGMDTERLPDAVCGDCLNLVQRRIMRFHDLRFGETTDTFTATAGVPSYALPANYRSPLDFSYTHPATGSRAVLRRRQKDQFDALHPDSTKTGRPANYAIWGDQLYLGPTPDSNLTVTRNYYAYLDDLSDGAPSNTNDLVTAAWDVLFFGALEEATKYGIEDARVPMWAERFRELETDLVREHQREKSVGRIAQSREPG